MCKISDGIILGLLILCSILDVRTKKIPIILLVGMSILVVIFMGVRMEQSTYSTLGGLLIGVVFCLISRLTREKIGYGDSWILLMLGGYLGWKKILVLMAAAFFLAGMFSVVGIIWRKWNRTVSIPFVPFLTAAYIGVMFL